MEVTDDYTAIQSAINYAATPTAKVVALESK
jgi:hypothetical protein